jgi:hypothetical protein
MKDARLRRIGYAEIKRGREAILLQNVLVAGPKVYPVPATVVPD